jgi:glycosyltransferase involved in cell wall biosynthesis
MDKSLKKGILEIHGTATKFGGASNGTKIIFEDLTKKKENIFLCYNRGNVVLNNSEIKKNRLPLPLSSKNPFIFILNTIKIIHFIIKHKITVVHTHHRNDTFYSCIVKLFVWRLKIYFTVHGPSVTNEPKSFFYIIIHELFLVFSNTMVNSVIYISKFTKELTCNSFKGIKNHKIIYNGTPTPSINKTIEEIRELIGVKKDGFIISIIGGIEGYKRPDLVIEIADLLKENLDLHFVFIGDGSEKEKIKNICVEKNLNNVRFVDVTQHIGDYINASDLGVP